MTNHIIVVVVRLVAAKFGMEHELRTGSTLADLDVLLCHAGDGSLYVIDRGCIYTPFRRTIAITISSVPEFVKNIKTCVSRNS